MPQATTERPTPSRVAATEQILVGLSTIAQAVHHARLHERLLRSAGVRLDRAGASLLSKLDRSGSAPPRVTALAERLGVDTPTVTRKLQQLERLGLVVRADDPKDRRALRIRLTPKGRSTVDRLGVARHAWLDELLEGWTDEERRSFADLLDRFSTRLAVELDGTRGD